MAEAVADALIAVDMGDGARGYFTTRAPAPAEEGGPYAGFNLALHVGDDPVRVEAHRHRLARALGIASDAAEDASGADGRAGIAG
ncbi:laccase domain-containing protein [Actinomyces ruminis]|uniref:laccase domain-containing protein n=1 Tax=Actinomyces ruminis TaxID=1937003 RepID=UPI00211DFC4B|nr:laccase domain-containing protein [Actinomyces ruminis]